MAPALKIPVTTRTDGRTVRTFRRRRQLHPPNHLLLPPRLSVWSFLLYTQRLLRPFFFLFCFVIRPVTLDREVGKRTVKEGAGSYKSKKKKKKGWWRQWHKLQESILRYRTGSVSSSVKRALVPLSFTNFFSSLQNVFLFLFLLKKKQKTRKIERRSVSCRPT